MSCQLYAALTNCLLIQNFSENIELTWFQSSGIAFKVAGSNSDCRVLAKSKVQGVLILRTSCSPIQFFATRVVSAPHFARSPSGCLVFSMAHTRDLRKNSVPLISRAHKVPNLPEHRKLRKWKIGSDREGTTRTYTTLHLRHPRVGRLPQWCQGWSAKRLRNRDCQVRVHGGWLNS